MDSDTFPQYEPVRRSKARKLSKIPDKSILKKRSRFKNISIDESTLKAYFPAQTIINRLNTLRKKKRPQCPTKSLIISKEALQVPNKLPIIEAPNPNMSKVRMSLKGKEDKLEKLINSFIEHKPQESVTHRSNQPVKFDFSPKNIEEKFYNQEVENFRGKEMVDYQNDLEKNLKIEKLRLKNYKKYKKRLQSN